MILKKLSARTYYRIGKNEALYGDDPLGPPERPEAYIAGYEDGCASPQTEKGRRHIWANAVLVAEIARWKQFVARHGLGEEDLRF